MIDDDLVRFWASWPRRDLWLLFRCPYRNNGCGLPYFATFVEESAADRSTLVLSKTIPLRPAKWPRNAQIERLSPRFYGILDEALAAEEYGLREVAGPGYRKALEFLIKDYLIGKLVAESKDSAETTEQRCQEIRESRRLREVIDQFDDETTRAVAHRTAWLGNDETHYERVWTQLDLGNLRELLTIVIRFIENRMAAARVLEEMPEGGPRSKNP